MINHNKTTDIIEKFNELNMFIGFDDRIKEIEEFNNQEWLLVDEVRKEIIDFFESLEISHKDEEWLKNNLLKCLGLLEEETVKRQGLKYSYLQEASSSSPKKPMCKCCLCDPNKKLIHATGCRCACHWNDKKGD